MQCQKVSWLIRSAWRQDERLLYRVSQQVVHEYGVTPPPSAPPPPRRTMGQTYQNLFKNFFHFYWILTEPLIKKGLEYSNYTWKYSSKTLELQFFISPFLNRIQRPGPLCTVHSWTLCAYGRCLLAPRRVFIGPVLFWQRMVVCHQKLSLSQFSAILNARSTTEVNKFHGPLCIELPHHCSMTQLNHPSYSSMLP